MPPERRQKNNESILIGYYDPFSVFSNVEDDLIRRFPIKKLPFKYDLNKPVMMIHELPVQFREEIPKNSRLQPPSSKYFHDRTYLRLMFVSADTVDLYRSQARPLILEWLKALVAEKNVAWAIVYVTSKSSPDKRSNLVRSSPFDKLMLDFAKGKQLKGLEGTDNVLPVEDNILRIKKGCDDETKKEEAYKKLYIRIRELILVSFSLRYLSNVYLMKLRGANNELTCIENLRLADSFGDLCFFDDARYHYRLLLEQVSQLGVREGAIPIDTDDFNFAVDFETAVPEEEYDANDLLLPLLKLGQLKTSVFPIRFGIFLKLAELLRRMSLQSESPSNILSCQVKLLEYFAQFANYTLRECSNNSIVNEWLYKTLDYYLSTKALTSLLASRAELESGNSTKYSMAELSKEIGELKMIQRRILNTLATEKGYELLNLQFFEELSLNDPREYTVSYTPLAAALKTEQAFIQAFDDLTTYAIREALASDRSETADLLSIDSAMLHYKKGDFESAHEILSSAYELYLARGWSMMGGIVLESYLKCAKKLDLNDPQEILPLYFKMFSLLKSKSVTQREPVHLFEYKSIKTSKDCQELLDEMYALSTTLSGPLRYPLLEFFSLNIEPGIQYNEKGECVIILKVKNEYPIPITVNQASIVLSNGGNGANMITFSCGKTTVGANSSTSIEVRSRIMRAGDFSTSSISFQLTDTLLLEYKEDLQTVRGLQGTVAQLNHRTTNSSLQASPKFAEMKFLMVPHPEQFHIEFRDPIKLNIRTPALDLIVFSGSRATDNVKVTVFKSVEAAKFVDRTEPQIIERLEPNTSQILTFQFPGDRKEIELQVKCTYDIDGEDFEFSISRTFDLSLDVSIVVNDIFRMKAIYSKFQVSAVDPRLPLKITDCEFTCPKGNYEVKSLLNVFDTVESLIVSSEQPAEFFFEVTHGDKESDALDTIDFRLTYTSLKMECERKVLKALRSELRQMDLLRFYYVFAPAISSLEFCWGTFFLTHEITAVNFSDINKVMNNRLDQYFSATESQKLNGILVKIFESEVSKHEVDLESRELYIAVEAPYLDILHVVGFHFERKSQFTIGETIDSELKINSSSKWAQLSEAKILASSSPNYCPPKQSFFVRIYEDDNWLLTGSQILKFEVASLNSTVILPVSLLPINSGEIVLPKVTIEPVNNQEIISNAVYENSLEAILVVPELETVTITL